MGAGNQILLLSAEPSFCPHELIFNTLRRQIAGALADYMEALSFYMPNAYSNYMIDQQNWGLDCSPFPFLGLGCYHGLVVSVGVGTSCLSILVPDRGSGP